LLDRSGRPLDLDLQSRGVRFEVFKAVFNHIRGSRGGIAGAYQRPDWAAVKRAALDALPAPVLAIVEGRTMPPNVVALAAPGSSPIVVAR
jgi:hypothetical protein